MNTIIVITRGGQGCTLLKQDEKTDYAAFSATSKDPTGAGDAFAAGFIYGYLSKWSLEKACKFANAMGALATTEYGAREKPIRLRDVLKLMEDAYARPGSV
jgi:sugar/nucleoside kinase (ribokinase family)